MAKDMIDYFIPWITRGSHPVCCFIYVHLPRSGMIRARSSASLCRLPQSSSVLVWKGSLEALLMSQRPVGRDIYVAECEMPSQKPEEDGEFKHEQSSRGSMGIIISGRAKDSSRRPERRTA